MPNHLRPSTLVIDKDEPCFNLSELNQLSPPPDQALHRFQIILVVRNDRLAEYRQDLGPTSKYTRPEFRIPGGVEVGHGRVEILHTVAELQEVADHLRNMRFEFPFVPTDLATEYRKFVERSPALVAHRTTFGPAGKVLR